MASTRRNTQPSKPARRLVSKSVGGLMKFDLVMAYRLMIYEMPLTPQLFLPRSLGTSARCDSDVNCRLGLKVNYSRNCLPN